MKRALALYHLARLAARRWCLPCVRTLASLGVVLALVAVGVVASAAPPAPTAGAPTSLGMRPPAVHGGFTDEMDCSACHTPSGWRLSSGAGASGFDHDRTGFALRGAHTRNACTACHTGNAKPLTSCEGCHRDPHQGRNDGACAECHTAVAWSDTGALEAHRRTRMPLTGRHAAIDCAACHRRSGARALRDLPADCYACHRTEYHQADIHPVHDGSSGGAALSRVCSQCHRTSGWTPATVTPGLELRAIARTAGHDAFRLTGNHRGAACTACHPDARRTQVVRCDGCHRDVALRAQHRAPVARSAAACLACHPRGAPR